MSLIPNLGAIVTPEFVESVHQYKVAGKIVPSVSSIIRPLTDAAYGMIDPATLRRAADFGTAVHACTELFDKDELDDDSVLPEWMPYLDAYKKWLDDVQPQIAEIEWRRGCARYAGTIDRVVEINTENWIVDLKTTSTIHPHVGVQLAAYVALAEPAYGVNLRRAALQLREDGSYKFVEFKKRSDFTCFNGLLVVHAWRTENTK